MVTNFKKLVVSCLGLLALVACKPTFEGTLDVREVLSLKAKKETLTVQPGVKAAKLSIQSKTEAKLEISVDGDDNNVSALFKIPSKQIPDNGSFKVSAKDVKQAYDIDGTMATDIQLSDYMYASEMCQYQVFAGYQCYPKPNGGETCYAIYHTVNGWRDIRYRAETTTQDLGFDLLKENTSVVSASFKGRNVTSQRVDVHVIGRCR